MIEKKQKGKDFIIKHFNISECGQKLYFVWFKYIKMVIVMKTSIVEKQVDALIKGGYYPNRAEFVEDAIRAFF